jgi:hypothetical protein
MTETTVRTATTVVSACLLRRSKGLCSGARRRGKEIKSLDASGVSECARRVEVDGRATASAHATTATAAREGRVGNSHRTTKATVRARHTAEGTVAATVWPTAAAATAPARARRTTTAAAVTSAAIVTSAGVAQEIRVVAVDHVADLNHGPLHFLVCSCVSDNPRHTVRMKTTEHWICNMEFKTCTNTSGG